MFLSFATSPKAKWESNFRDLGGAVTRMATLAPQGRVTVNEAREEIDRLRNRWQGSVSASHDDQVLKGTLGTTIDELDLFDKVTLSEVIRVCRASANLSDAGRTLFGISRLKKKNTNDSDRLRKYLAKFDLDWEKIK